MNRLGHRRRLKGSAAVELVAVIPFALVLTAAIMDLRAFAAHRSDIAREIYTVAEIVAGAGLWAAASADAGLRKTMAAASTRLQQNTSGWMRVVVVARPRDDPGDPTATPPVLATPARNSDGNLCNPAANPPFCEPEVLAEVDFDAATAGIQRAEWGGAASDGNRCATTDSGMPVEGATFGRDAVVLPNEAADPDGSGPTPPPAATDWVSRTLNSDEWWAVVEVCTHFGGGTSTPGLFEGAMSGLTTSVLRTFDVTGSGAWLQRVAWGSHESLDDCTWCGAIGAGSS